MRTRLPSLKQHLAAIVLVFDFVNPLEVARPNRPRDMPYLSSGRLWGNCESSFPGGTNSDRTPSGVGRLNMGLKELFGFRKPKVVTRVLGDAIVVTLPGTTLRVAYQRQNGSLIATDFAGTDIARKITMPVFLSEAWNAANEKARELRWLA